MYGTNADFHPTLTIAGKAFSLEVGSLIIGNAVAVGCKQDVIFDDPSVDVKHAVLDISQNTVKLMDLFSVHGTYVDGKKVKKFEIIELLKNSKLQFGSVQCQFRTNAESESGFLSISNSSMQDTSIIPNSQVENESNRNHRNKTSITSTPTNLAVQSHAPSTNDDGEDDDNSILVKVTQNEPDDENMFGNITDISLQRNGFEEDDDFFIPETQEIFPKQSIQNESCDFFQLNTQDFRGEINDTSNSSDNLIANVSYQDSIDIPFIAPPSKDDLDNDVKLEDLTEAQPVVNAVVSDNDDTDCEEEMSILRWNDKSNGNTTTKSASVTPDLDLDVKEVDIGEECLEATQAFIFPTAKVDENTDIASKEEKDDENDSIICLELDPTQVFVLPKTVVKSPTVEKLVTNSNLEETQIFHFKAPLQPAPIRQPVFELDDDLAPTQVFEPINKRIISPVKSSKNENEDDDLEPTQAFVFTRPPIPREASKSPILLDSDEEDNNSEFCFQTTLVVSDNAPSVKKCIESAKKTNSKKLSNKLFGSSDEEDDDVHKLQSHPEATPPIARQLVVGVQPTPDFAFIKLPNVNKIGVADDLFQKTIKPFVKTLLQESSDDDDERHDSSEQIDRLLNESKTVKAAKETTKSKRVVRKVSTYSDKVEKATETSNKTSSKSKKETVKVKKANQESKSTVTRKTRLNGKTKSDKTSDEITNTAIQLPKRTSSRNKSIPDERNKRQHQQQNELMVDTSDSKAKISADKIVIEKSESVEKVAMKRHQSIDGSEMAKKRSKENVPTTSDSHVTIESSVTPLRKTTRQKHRIVFTKLDSKPYTNLIEKIDGCIVENPADCTVLITDTIYRTWKFLAAMAKGIPIVSIEWLQVASTCRDSLTDYDDYLINDSDAERRYKFSLKKSLARARKSPLLKGYTFHCTPNTKPTPKEIYDIVECAGARVVSKIPRHFKKPEHFYVVSDKLDMDSWPYLRDVVRSLSIISAEGILTAVTQQCVNFKSHILTK